MVGKTTLLNLLMGTAYYAHVTGDLKVNNRKVVRGIILVSVAMTYVYEILIMLLCG